VNYELERIWNEAKEFGERMLIPEIIRQSCLIKRNACILDSRCPRQDFTAISRECDATLLAHPIIAVGPNDAASHRSDIFLNNTRESGHTELHCRSNSSRHETARSCNLQDINGT
jgi:hypothetical protein